MDCHWMFGQVRLLLQHLIFKQALAQSAIDPDSSDALAEVMETGGT